LKTFHHPHIGYTEGGQFRALVGRFFLTLTQQDNQFDRKGQRRSLTADSDFSVAIAAIYRFATAGLEGNLGLAAALSAGGRVILPLRSVAVTIASAGIFVKFDFPGCPTPRTTLRPISLASRSKTLLFLGR